MKTMQIDGTAVAVRETGDGTPVVLLHCTGSSGNQWRAMADGMLAGPLAGGSNGRGYRLIMPDLRGYGESEAWSGRGPMRLADDAAIVRALADRVGEPLHLVGHSYGGAVALAAALQAPEALSSLTLIEPAAFFLLRGGSASDHTLFVEIAAVGERIAKGLVSGDYRPALEHFVDYWSGRGTWQSMAPQAHDMLCRRIAAIALNFASTTGETTPLEAAARLKLPTLLLTGTRTKPIARRVVERLMWTLPNATLREIEGAGHMLPLTHPSPVAYAVGDHVTGREDAVVHFLERCAA
jgi:pimeloyl-ACP methyl ester carboxylesterase